VPPVLTLHQRVQVHHTRRIALCPSGGRLVVVFLRFPEEVSLWKKENSSQINSGKSFPHLERRLSTGGLWVEGREWQ
jgi:hypothetical protein